MNAFRNRNCVKKAPFVRTFSLKEGFVAWWSEMVWVPRLDITICNTIKQGRFFLRGQETYRENEAWQKSTWVRIFKDIEQITEERKRDDMGQQHGVDG